LNITTKPEIEKKGLDILTVPQGQRLGQKKRAKLNSLKRTWVFQHYLKQEIWGPTMGQKVK
jgi:hypothetical protein